MEIEIEGLRVLLIDAQRGDTVPPDAPLEQLPAQTGPPHVWGEEEHLQPGAVDAHKSHGDALIGEGYHQHRDLGQSLGDVDSQGTDVLFGQEVVGGPDGGLPHLAQAGEQLLRAGIDFQKFQGKRLLSGKTVRAPSGPGPSLNGCRSEYSGMLVIH